MAWEEAGFGLGSGIISSVLVALGMKSRIDRIENIMVSRETCEKCSENNENQIYAIHESQVRIERKLDDFMDNFSRRRGDKKR